MILALLARLRDDVASRRMVRRVGACAAFVLSSQAAAFADDSANGARGSDGNESSSYTCRMSVLNGGNPRGVGVTGVPADEATAATSNPFAEGKTNLDRSRWTFAGGDAPRAAAADADAPAGGQPIAGDFNGDGVAEIGLFVDGEWFIDLNGNGVWDRDDLWARLGSAADQPVVGDWDGDGKADIGVFGPDAAPDDNRSSTAGLPDAENQAATTTREATNDRSDPPVRLLKLGADGEVRADAVDFVLDFGSDDGLAVAGDFNGDGIDTIAVFRDGKWFVDVDGDGQPGAADIEAQFGEAGDRPVAGDFDGDGIDQVGVYRNGKWFIPASLTERNSQSDTVILLGEADDAPAVGDFDGDGRDEAAVYDTK